MNLDRDFAALNPNRLCPRYAPTKDKNMNKFDIIVLVGGIGFLFGMGGFLAVCEEYIGIGFILIMVGVIAWGVIDS